MEKIELKEKDKTHGKGLNIQKRELMGKKKKGGSCSPDPFIHGA